MEMNISILVGKAVSGRIVPSAVFLFFRRCFVMERWPTHQAGKGRKVRDYEAAGRSASKFNLQLFIGTSRFSPPCVL